MESMVEENGSAVDPLSAGSQSGDAAPAIATSVQSLNRTQQQTHHLVASTSIVQLTLPTSGTTQVQSVIQPNQQSVIQTATNIQPVAISKGNVILVSKPNSVIQTAQASLQTLQVVETGSDDSFSDSEESPEQRGGILTRRPSYKKILNDLGGGEITDGRLPPLESSSECDSNVDSEVSSHSLHYQTVIPAGTIQIATQGEGVPGLHTLTMSNAATAGGAIVQYAQGQDTQFFVPGHGVVVEDAARKRELRLLKNRQAARECRRKKKEYIKCLENRVAILENRNQTLIEELKSLKQLCEPKTD
ncbi:cyclic AMP-responsive element-binding protein 1 isoform X4 [Apis laboriosa]|uniref:Cyclic AMP-responsive element-binding protein 1 isoform X3 n=3 Tax=Apis TaxID=7459 RepID=A0A7M7RA49_APIME|nr:cyclic AMP-responsive element-binding protein 1 isoform X3 [Apis florea]XP_006570115.1 cyclic AMP-responsive element-binding protein 1 isoform X3 [Apis mellifera]XP_006612605.1 cyclic AMP-responsive element-binding protein 1 isoform X3 [Apis dorsata]XP_006612606.1 cyclic AMP-responsive element-binding protein 1 isoform X3 [Apis dorsata]XP_012341964.1 cyclic AMP-responsive element-binding protein 1 isoform X3 [Apis florea]XP_043796276.1 cyclic AMP-responsive element-binding protein 1 isoform|eukprot:XP_006570115.1 cyclic AMP-responsive element-binding protein 1 isoform X3 [Apis mellifera]